MCFQDFSFLPVQASSFRDRTWVQFRTFQHLWLPPFRWFLPWGLWPSLSLHQKKRTHPVLCVWLTLSYWIFLNSFVSALIFLFKLYFLYLKLSFLCFRYCLNLVCCQTSGKHLSRTASINLSSAASAEECIEIIHCFISRNGTGSSQYVQPFIINFP